MSTDKVRYVVEKGSDSDRNCREVVLSGGEVAYRCRFCPCVFSSAYDVELHLTACRKKREKYSFKFGYIGSCKKPDEDRIHVKNTVSNVLLCCGCRYFLGKDDKRVV